MQEARVRRAWGLDGEAPRLRLPDRTESQSSPRPMERFTPGVHKRRFVQDGEVPVMVVHGLTGGRRDHADPSSPRPATAAPMNRLEVAETALATEIASRERVEKSLAEAQAMVQQLQTKLGHADLARQDAVAALQRERDSVAELHTALAEAQERAAAAEAAEAAAEAAAEDALAAALAGPLRTEPAAVRTEAAPVRPEPARRGRKPKLHAGPGRPPGKAPKPAIVASDGGTDREPKPVRWWLTPKRSAKTR
ncbi:MAG TPA: hypothetical protein VGG99_26660 [Acetobacteraceae bacterium]|jgi:hypothetical protein